jgi:hypothetical protein
MVNYVEALSGEAETTDDEDETQRGGISDAEGTSPKDEHPEYGVPRTTPLSEDEGEEEGEEASAESAESDDTEEEAEETGEPSASEDEEND